MLDAVLGLWIVLTLASTGYVAYDLIVRTPEIGVMKLGWVLVLNRYYSFARRSPVPEAVVAGEDGGQVGRAEDDE